MQQLRLWPEMVICQHCGRPTPIKPPAVLQPTTARVYEAVKRLARTSEQVNATDVAALANCSHMTAIRHLEQLRRDHVVIAVKKRVGGSYRAWKLA